MQNNETTRGVDWVRKVEERLRSILIEAGLSVKSVVEQPSLEDSGPLKVRPDILMEIVKNAGQRWDLVVEVKSIGEPRMARLALQQLREFLKWRKRSYGIFAAPYITRETGELCRREGAGYIDAAGNCYLSFGPVCIQIEGRPNVFKTGKQFKSLFSRKSSRVLRVMLTNPSQLWFVRDLARETNISLGQVSSVKRRLLDFELIKEEKKGFRLVQPEKLLMRWTENYRYSKNPSRNFYSFQSPSELEGAIADYCRNNNVAYAFTMFSGAARVAPFVRYNRSFVYVAQLPFDAIDNLQLKEVQTGTNLTILTPYDEGLLYGLQEVNGQNVVCDVQLYLDLKSFGGRGEEAAEVVLDKRLKTKW